MTSDTEDRTVAIDAANATGTTGTAAPAPTDARVRRSRSKILDAATRLLVEAGPRAVTVDAVAARAGVSKATLYRHWGSRDELVADVLRHNRPPPPEIERDLPFEDALRTIVATVAAQAADREWQRILPALFSLKHQLDEVEALADVEREEQLEVFDAVLRLGVAAGRVRPDYDLELCTLELVGPLVLGALGIGGEAPLRIADRVVDDFLAAHR